MGKSDPSRRHHSLRKLDTRDKMGNISIAGNEGASKGPDIDQATLLAVAWSRLVMQPVSAVALSPPATITPQSAPVHDQVEINSEALPPPSAAQASQFADLIKNSRINEVTLQNRPVQRGVTSKISASINGAMKHLAESEARAHLDMGIPQNTAVTHALSRAPTTEVDHGHHDGPANSASEHAQSVPGPAFDHFSIKDVFDYGNKVSNSTLTAIEFELESTLYGKVVEKGDGAINQLVQEK